jgi:hypothetical protein
MNVKELIEQLQDCDPNMEVVLGAGDNGDTICAVEVCIEHSPYDQDFDRYIVKLRG